MKKLFGPENNPAKFTSFLHFGGFYGTYHELAVDEFVRYCIGGVDDDGNDLEIDSDEFGRVDYRKIYEQYSERYVDKLNDYVKDEFGVDVGFTYIDLHSPKEYNHYTDTIEVFVGYEGVYKLLKSLESDKKFVKRVEIDTTFREGYSPHYNFSDIFGEDLKIVDESHVDYNFAVMCISSYIAENWDFDTFDIVEGLTMEYRSQE